MGSKQTKHTMSDLYQMQSLPLSAKIRMTERRIRDWIDCYGEDGVCISFSGGKDSTVLVDIICNKMGLKNIPAVFVNVPTQYPELKEFSEWFCEENDIHLDIVNPKISFAKVCEKYGFPLASKEVAHKFDDLYSAQKHGTDSYVLKQLDGTYITKNGKKTW